MAGTDRWREGLTEQVRAINAMAAHGDVLSAAAAAERRTDALNLPGIRPA